MISIFKTLCRVCVIGGLALTALAGGSILLAGSSRTEAVIQDVQARIEQVIDENLDDPAALRRELRNLEEEYPERISNVRRDLSGLRRDIGQLQRDVAISKRVVELAEEDLATLAPAMREATAQASSGRSVNLVAFVVEDQLYTLDNAQRRLRKIKTTRDAHADRASESSQQLAFLRQQEGQFQKVIDQLEQEQAQFRVQLSQLNRQVDSIQRNERMIEMLDKRRRTLEQCTTYDLASLGQLTGKLEQILTEQSAELDLLSDINPVESYEGRANEELRTGTLAENMRDQPTQ